jgi:hypothetical protein
LYFWENKKEEKQITQISRNETLSRLPVRLSTNRIIELVQLRDITRPVSITFSIFNVHCMFAEINCFSHLFLKPLFSHLSFEVYFR